MGIKYNKDLNGREKEGVGFYKIKKRKRRSYYD